MQAQREQSELPEWQVRLRERLLTKNGEGAEAILSELSTEEALTCLRDTLLPEVQSQGSALAVRNITLLVLVFSAMTARFVRSFLKDFYPHLLTPTLYIVMAVLIGVLFVLWLFAIVRSKRLARLWASAYPLFTTRLISPLGSEAASALIDIFGWFGGFALTPPLSTANQESHNTLILTTKKTLIRLLNRLAPEEALGLTENNRVVLRRLAQNAEDEVDMGIAALLTLGTMGEGRVRPVAQKLTTSFLPRVREAAKECLGQLPG